MMKPAYPAAREAAIKVLHKFGPLADVATIEAVIDAAFWASLRREEDSRPRISLALLPPEAAAALTLERPLRLTPQSLTRLAPAVEHRGIHLGVWSLGEELFIWGIIGSIPERCFVLEVSAPGLLVIKHSRGEDSAKFVNIAVIEGDRIKILDQRATTTPDCPALVGSLLGFDSPAGLGSDVNVLMQLAVAMRAHGRGGSLLVVPGHSERWRESIVHPIPYAASPSYSELASLVQADASEELSRAIETVGGLTAVDGATVITEEHELLAFGAKIGRRDGWGAIERVLVTEPIEGATPTVADPAELGGTRHLSAAQFAQDQRDAVALVASQDGRFTVFAWSDCANLVQAHRVEALLL